MRRWLLSVFPLLCLAALSGCQACNNCSTCSSCGSGAGGCGAGVLKGCGWHGVCDCQADDQCCMRQPWLYNNVAASPAAPIVPASAPLAPVRPMALPGN
jgi:hypothetical protein